MVPRRGWLAAIVAVASGGVGGCMDALGHGNGGGLHPTGVEPADTTAVSQFRGDAQHTGRSEAQLSPSAEEAWQIEVGYSPTMSELFATAETVFFIHREGLEAYEPTGERRWQNNFWNIGGLPNTPAVTPDTVYVPLGGEGAIKNNAAGIAAFALGDGSVRWRALTNDHTITPITLIDGILLTCGFSDDAYTFAVDAKTGEELWREPVEELAPGNHDDYDSDTYWEDIAPTRIWERMSAPAAADGTVYVTLGGPSRLIALDMADGSRQWQVELNELDEPAESRIGGAPTVYDGVIYVGTREGGLYAIDESGELEWAKPIEIGVTDSIAIDATGVYVPTEDTLLALDHTGKERWTVGVNDSQPTPSITDEYLISGDRDVAFMRTKADGEVVWTFDPESKSIGDVILPGRPVWVTVGGETIYLLTDTRRIIALE